MTLSYLKRNSDALPIWFLPAERAGSNPRNPREAHAVHSLSSQQLQSLERTAEHMGAELENLLLAAFAALLMRLTRQGNLAIAVDSSQLAIFNLEDDCSFRAVIGQSQNRKSAVLPKGQSPEQTIRYQFLTGEPSDSEAVDFGLRLVVRSEGNVLQLASPIGLWGNKTLQAWLGYLLTLVRAAAENPDLAVSCLPLWDESEARRFYNSLNRTAVEFPGESSIPGRFTAQAIRRPDATAVVAGHARYTYRELEERSNELAKHLIAAGAGAGRTVAVCMERTVDLPMTLLAVLKSGACYVPLDPHNPGARLRSILEECNPVALLSDSSVASSLSATLKMDSVPIFCVDRPLPEYTATGVAAGAQTAAGDPPSFPVPIHPQDLAYIIYTSGTTGIPKGVRIAHQSLLNLVCSMWRKPGISETDRTLAVAPISFDIATMDMFLPICSGGTLVIASRQDAVDPYHLAQLIKDHDITCMQATPATWRMMITSGWTGKRNLKMIAGGEALPRELANDLLDRGGELWNCYGPTETAIYSGVLRIEPEQGIVPVGPPIANTTFYVLDKARQLVPPGISGELYIGGVGVSPGYVNRPELTAQRFIPDSFTCQSHGSTGSLFATGDLVRIVNGDQFEFFGRSDHQVKLRGYRIELGEIESVLRTHPSITDAVVVLREDLPGEPRLVAYVIFNGLPIGAAALREFASTSLPEYMLPTLVVALEQFPLSASGKINRRALPAPESVPRQIAADHPEAEAAGDPLEARLLQIFRDLLKNDSIGVTDSFFRYGGYSLLTVSLFAQIDRELGARLPISLLFDAPTVRDLARVIRKGLSPSVIVPIRPYGRSAPIFLVQSYLLYNAILEIIEPDRPVYGVREMGDEREPMSMAERARKFTQEILSVCPHGPLYLAGWCAAGPLTVEIACQLREAGHEVGLVALFDAECPGFTLPKGILPWLSRFSRKIVFHSGRVRRIPWPEKAAYIYDALVRNWDGAVESFYMTNFRTMLWLKKRFGISLSETAFDNVYASMSALRDIAVRPYPGKLNLFRAADIPDFAEIDKTLGWCTIAQEGVKVNFVRGDHVSMFKKPNNTSLARRLQQELQEFETPAFSE